MKKICYREKQRWMDGWMSKATIAGKSSKSYIFTRIFTYFLPSPLLKNNTLIGINPNLDI